MRGRRNLNLESQIWKVKSPDVGNRGAGPGWGVGGW